MTIFITWQGMTKNKTQWGEYFGIGLYAFSCRLRNGVPMEKMGEDRRRYNHRPKGSKDRKARVRTQQHNEAIGRAVRDSYDRRRLAKLLAEFEAAADDFATNPANYFLTNTIHGEKVSIPLVDRRQINVADAAQGIVGTTALYLHQTLFACPDRLISAAQRYIIARDFREFDPKKADMIWKLQNGGVQ